VAIPVAAAGLLRPTYGAGTYGPERCGIDTQFAVPGRTQAEEVSPAVFSNIVADNYITIVRLYFAKFIDGILFGQHKE